MAKTLTKDELVNLVATKLSLTMAQTHAVVQATLDTIQQALAEQRKVEFRNFGVFRPALRKARKGRNPRDPSRVYDIPAHSVVKFKMGSHLEAALNPAQPPPAPDSLEGAPKLFDVT